MTVRFQADLEKLSSFNFKKNVIYESIISTPNPDHTPNTAPMGVTMLDEKHLTLTIFNTSKTLRNLKTAQCAVINLTSDIEVFYKSTFKEINPEGKVPSEWFVQANFVKAPKLRDTDAALEVLIVNFKPIDDEKTEVTCRVQHITSKASYPQPYSRAMALTLETLIHATRIEAYLKIPQKQTETAKLIEKIRDYADIVERVAPNSIYTLVLDDLQKRIALWRQEP
ncbi:MAG: DUF447 family protein [Nitrososphaerota archaeon]|uniref:DUF447 domain-containing protein n=1 Tax=Candidatus Bathycorpusculum sp. TaxID=2994959 RepID=UPI002833AC14|nr:DUF447 family protein [Candidatus Termitimicrobium sp.]MCL2431047.1 DUF447 family protein [Candidatus Termitimicrobium sp.]MDR0493752.1 DUF447 family protein [Nitrososphaerota archaeon]